MIQKIGIDGLAIPASWSFFTSETCREASGRLSSGIRQWLKSHEHSHVYREILAVVRGSCVLKASNRTLELREGEMILLRPQERHTSGHLPDDHAVYWWCMLAPGKLEMLLWRDNRLNSISILPVGIFDQVLTRLLDECCSPAAGPHAEYEITQIMSALICDFFRREQAGNSRTENTYQNAVMQKILIYIDSAAAVNCPLSSLATLAGYSRTHFQRLFREYTGCSFRDYMEKKRIERYHSLQDKINLSKKEISNLLGFSSTAALNHWEKKMKLRRAI